MTAWRSEGRPVRRIELIDPDELAERLEGDDLVVLDVRDERRVRRGTHPWVGPPPLRGASRAGGRAAARPDDRRNLQRRQAQRPGRLDPAARGLRATCSTSPTGASAPGVAAGARSRAANPRNFRVQNLFDHRMRRTIVLVSLISVLAGMLLHHVGAFGIKAGHNLPTDRLEAAYKIALFERRFSQDGCYPRPRAPAKAIHKGTHRKVGVAPEHAAARQPERGLRPAAGRHCGQVRMALRAIGGVYVLDSVKGTVRIQGRKGGPLLGWPAGSARCSWRPRPSSSPRSTRRRGSRPSAPAAGIRSAAEYRRPPTGPDGEASTPLL